MKIIPEKEEYIKMTIRNSIALNPLVSIRKMQEMVEKNTGRSISDKYAAKLMRKVRRQAVVESDRKQINERLAEVRERYRMLIEDLTRTIYWKPDFLNDYGLHRPSFKERHAAIKLVAQLELALFKAELDAGMFQDRRTAIAEMLKQGVLPTELQEQIVSVFRTWKVSPLTAAKMLPES